MLIFFLKFIILLEAIEKNVATPLPVPTGWALLVSTENRTTVSRYPSHVVINVLPELPAVRNEYMEE